MSSNAFSPLGDSACLSVTSTSTSTPIQVKGPNNNATQHLISNLGAKTCFFAWGTSSIAAVAPTAGSPANGIPIPAGALMTLSFPPNVYFAAITAGSDTTTLYITPGEGN